MCELPVAAGEIGFAPGVRVAGVNVFLTERHALRILQDNVVAVAPHFQHAPLFLPECQMEITAPHIGAADSVKVIIGGLTGMPQLTVESAFQ